MHINLDIGHSPQDGGAIDSTGTLNEYRFWRANCGYIKSSLEARGHKVSVSNRSIYGRGSLDAARASNACKPDLILSLHLNAYNTRAQGCEVLHWYDNAHAAKLAAELSLALSLVLDNPNRGAKPKKKEDRGGTQIARSVATCLILEPCFVDNPTDFARLQNRLPTFGAAIAHVIDSFFGAELKSPKIEQEKSAAEQSTEPKKPKPQNKKNTTK